MAGPCELSGSRRGLGFRETSRLLGIQGSAHLEEQVSGSACSCSGLGIPAIHGGLRSVLFHLSLGVSFVHRALSQMVQSFNTSILRTRFCRFSKGFDSIVGRLDSLVEAFRAH